jgi:cytochrome P450 family 307 subfamily A
MDIALFALEDILGGHSAVANFALRAFIDIAARPSVQGALRQELQETLLGSEFSLAERSSLPTMQATVHESVRFACAPIVPRVAHKDTTIGG